MSTADVMTLAVFLIALLSGGLGLWVHTRRQQRPEARIRQRVQQLRETGNRAHLEAMAGAERARIQARERARRNPLARWLMNYVARVRTLGGNRAWATMGLATACGLLAALLFSAFTSSPWWGVLALFVALPVGAAVLAHRSLVRRFKKQFLVQLPQAIDMIMRASMAGVPATLAIRSAGDDIPAPLGPEFRDIGDSLYLGEDLEEVLRDAMARIDIPEFSFFGVYLMVQRSTGGSMSETLQNLASVIRGRGELDLKVRAMTAEGRASSMVMSILPFAVFGLLYVFNRDYVMTLFTTDAGNRLLIISITMIVIGILFIRRLARLED